MGTCGSAGSVVIVVARWLYRPQHFPAANGRHAVYNGDMLALLAAVSLLQVQEAEIPAMVGPLERLIPEIGTRLNMKLIAGASVKSDVVGIASPKRPAKVIMDGIAAAVNATWEERPEGWVLARSRKQELEDEESDAKHREAWIRKSLESTPIDTPFDEIRAKALAEYWFEFKSKKEHEPLDYAQLDTMNARSPLGRFTRRLIEAFGVAQLARVPQRTVTVFSTRPTKMQRPMPIKNFDALIAKFTEEQNRYAKAIKEKGAPQDGHNGQFVSGFDTVSPIHSGYEKIRVAIDTRSSSQTFLRVEFCSAQGKPLASARAYLNRGFEQPKPAEGLADEIQLDEASRSFLERAKRERALFSDEAMAIIDVLRRDPLENVHREAVGAWSQQLQAPIIASLSDDNVVTQTTTPYRLSTYRQFMTSSHSLTDAQGTIILRPLAPYEARLKRVDRRALQKAIDVRLAQGTLSIAAAVDFSASLNPNSSSTGNWLVWLALPEFRNMNAGGLLSILAHGFPSQRDELLAGGAIRLRDLNPTQRTLVERFIYGQSEDSFFGLTSRVDAKDPLPAEPTEAFPDGIPDSFVLRTESNVSDGARFKQANFRIPYSLGELAEMASYDQTRGMEFQPCKVRLLRFDVTITASRGYEAIIREARVDPKVGWGPYDSLPKALRDEIERQAAIIKQRRVPPP